jgi:type IV pilus assembly protein PilN
MRISINLATQPLRRGRPIVVGAVAMSVALVGLLGLLISLAIADRAQLKDSRAGIAGLEAQLRRLTAEQARQEAVLREPENAAVLERSLFLNMLLYRKGISWTRIFADLEETLPYNVRLIAIRPSVNARDQVSLEMEVGAESPEPAIGLLKSLESSPLFSSAFIRSWLPPSQTNPLYRYRVSVNYAQHL